MTCVRCARSAPSVYGPCVALVALILMGCGRTATEGQIGFRVRSDFGAGLNDDTGWAAALNENAAIVADQPFRIRFEISHGATTSSDALRLQYRRNGGDWTDVAAHEFPYSDADDAETPRVSIVTCDAYKNGEPTSDVLRGASAAFQAGAGVSLSDRTSASHGASSHSEFEWAVVVRRYADGAVTNEQDDTFEFRMTRASGGAFESSLNPVLRLSIPPGHLGGTFVETPGRIGPWRTSAGHLYFIMEPAETDNVFMMMKSTDEGRTWREVDAAHRPATDDLESVDARFVGDTIHIVHQVTETVRHHSFRTADHPTQPDSWAIRDELVATVESIAQAATLVVRSDGSMVAFYVGETVRYSTRSPAGQWTPTKPVGANLAGPQAVLGADDTVHVAGYRTDGTLWYRRLLSDGTLTASQQLASGAGTTRAEYGAVLPLVFIPETKSVSIVYRLADGILWERRVTADGILTPASRVTDREVVHHAVDSQQPGADLVSDGSTAWAFFIDRQTRSIYSTERRTSWQPSRRHVEHIQGTWIRGSVYTRSDGARVYGYVYDAGSEGGSGMNRFAEVVLGGG